MTLRKGHILRDRRKGRGSKHWSEEKLRVRKN